MRGRTIVATDERVSVTVSHNSIDVFFSLFQRNIHIAVKTRQQTLNAEVSAYESAERHVGRRTSVIDTGCQPYYNPLPDDTL
jgi:hypothetical protein